MAACLALVLLAQQEIDILRRDKDAYGTPVADCDKAAGLIESAPAQAVELLDKILENAKVVHREVRLRIEILSGTYSRKYDFFPYQFRGRARMQLAEKAAPERALVLLKGAVEDLAESVRRGLDSSKPLIEQARARLAKLEAESRGGPDPEFLRAWRELLNSRRFAAAKAHIDSKGQALSDEQRRQYVADTERACRDCLAAAASSFLASLELVPSVKALLAMRQDVFDRSFELPDPAHLLETTPEYLWCADVRAGLAQMRERKTVLPRLFDHAVAGLALSPDGRGFLTVENLAFDVARAELERRVADARDASADRRLELRAEADSLLDRWRTFERRAREATQDRPDLSKLLPTRDLAAALERFPVDDESVNSVAARLKATAGSDDPDRALADVEGALDKLFDRWDRLSLESRRAILTHRIAAGALRGLLSGKTVDQVARELRRFGDDLKSLSGSFDVRSYGAKVQKVFDRLR